MATTILSQYLLIVALNLFSRYTLFRLFLLHLSIMIQSYKRKVRRKTIQNLTQRNHSNNPVVKKNKAGQLPASKEIEVPALTFAFPSNGQKSIPVNVTYDSRRDTYVVSPTPKKTTSVTEIRPEQSPDITSPRNAQNAPPLTHQSPISSPILSNRPQISPPPPPYKPQFTPITESPKLVRPKRSPRPPTQQSPPPNAIYRSKKPSKPAPPIPKTGSNLNNSNSSNTISNFSPKLAAKNLESPSEECIKNDIHALLNQVNLILNTE